MNRRVLIRVIQRTTLFPGARRRERALPPVLGLGLGAEALHVHDPPVVLGARAGEQRARAELDRFGSDRAEHPIRQPDGVGPGPTLVRGSSDKPPPFTWAGTDLVEQQKRPTRRLEQYRVPAGIAAAVLMDPVGHFDRRRPAGAVVSGQPDADVGISLRGPAEPRRGQSVGRFHDRRGMGGRKWRLLVDKVGGDGHRRLLGRRIRVRRSARRRSIGRSRYGYGGQQDGAQSGEGHDPDCTGGAMGRRF